MSGLKGPLRVRRGRKAHERDTHERDTTGEEAFELFARVNGKVGSRIVRENQDLLLPREERKLTYFTSTITSRLPVPLRCTNKILLKRGMVMAAEQALATTRVECTKVIAFPMISRSTILAET